MWSRWCKYTNTSKAKPTKERWIKSRFHLLTTSGVKTFTEVMQVSSLYSSFSFTNSSNSLFSFPLLALELHHAVFLPLLLLLLHLLMWLLSQGNSFNILYSVLVLCIYASYFCWGLSLLGWFVLLLRIVLKFLHFLHCSYALVFIFIGLPSCICNLLLKA